MRRKRVVQWSVVGVVVLLVFLITSGLIPGRAPAAIADITFIIALDTDTRVGTSYSIRYVPTSLLIDQEGVVRGRKIGPFGDKGEVLDWLDSVTAGEAEPAGSGVAPEVGYVAPDFVLTTLDGQTVALSQLRGKKVLLTFWTTWCPACVAQEPYLQAAYEEIGGEVEFIGINLGESRERVSRHISGDL